MTRAVLLAAAAGALTGAALAELAAAGPRGRARSSSAGGLLRALARVGRLAGAVRPAGDLGGRIAAAGTPLGVGVREVAAAKAGAALAALGVLLPLISALPARAAIVVGTAGPAVAWCGPDLWLRRRARARSVRIERELPDVLDLVRVALDAGLSLARAQVEVARRHPGLLAAELGRAAREQQLGATRADALAELTQRCPSPGVRALVAAVERSERLGAPLATTLVAQAADARATRARQVREAADRAAPKIQLVVALGLVPSAMLLIAAALLAGLTSPR